MDGLKRGVYGGVLERTTYQETRSHSGQRKNDTENSENKRPVSGITAESRGNGRGEEQEERIVADAPGMHQRLSRSRLGVETITVQVGGMTRKNDGRRQRSENDTVDEGLRKTVLDGDGSSKLEKDCGYAICSKGRPTKIH